MHTNRSIITIVDNGQYLESYDSWDPIFQEQWHSITFHVIVVTTDIVRSQQSPLLQWLKGNCNIEYLQVYEVKHQALNDSLQKLYMMSHCENQVALHTFDRALVFNYFVHLESDFPLLMNPWAHLATTVANDKFCLMQERNQMFTQTFGFLITNDIVSYSIIQNTLYFVKSQITNDLNDWLPICGNIDALPANRLGVFASNHIQRHLIKLEFVL